MPQSLSNEYTYYTDNTKQFSVAQPPLSYDWRTQEYPSDILTALVSLYGKEDWSLRATISASAMDSAPQDIDMVIQNISINIQEHIQIQDQVGDSFGLACFGKSPLVATISGVLIDTHVNFGKQFLIDAYKNKLRISAAARTGRIPTVRFLDSILRGPFIDMRVSEDINSEDTIIVVFSMLVMSLTTFGVHGLQTFDYVHGDEPEMESEIDKAAAYKVNQNEAAKAQEAKTLRSGKQTIKGTKTKGTQPNGNIVVKKRN